MWGLLIAVDQAVVNSFFQHRFEEQIFEPIYNKSFTT